jgi:predicted enzyme related to lactoylglutathione lyase
MSDDKHPTFGNGKICYIQMPAKDINQSAEFYEKVFGWRIRRGTHGDLSFDDGVGEVSGRWTTARKPDSDPGMVVYIMVDSVASTIEVIVKTGGLIVQPVGKDAPEITAKFSDPAGNVFGLYQQPG